VYYTGIHGAITEVEEIKPFKPAESTGFLVGRVAHHLKIGVQGFLDEAGIALSAEEISILTVLAHEEEPERISLLAELLGRDATTLSRQIDGLEQDCLAQRAPDPDDGRAVVVSITAVGKRLVNRTMPLTFDLRRRAMRGISERDEKVVVRVLKRMLASLRDDE